MTKQEIINLLSGCRNGTYKGLTIKKDMSKEMTAAARKAGEDLVKVSNVVIRIGVQYSHIKAIAAQLIAQGLDPEKAGLTLPWGEWDPDCSYLIRKEVLNENKEPTGEYTYYLRCTLTKNQKQRGNSKWFYKGEEISVDQVKALGIIRDSYWAKTAPEEIYTEPLSAIVAVR